MLPARALFVLLLVDDIHSSEERRRRGTGSNADEAKTIRAGQNPASGSGSVDPARERVPHRNPS